jgi:hypothetical protein
MASSLIESRAKIAPVFTLLNKKDVPMSNLFVLLLCLQFYQGSESKDALDALRGSNILFDTTVGVSPPAAGAVSQNFTDLPNSTQAFAADDFTVPDCGWEVERVVLQGSYAEGSGPATSFNLFVLAKTGSLPVSTDPAGTALFIFNNVAYAETSPGVFEIPISGGLILPEGDYWLIAQANMSSSVGGQWLWSESSLTPNSGTTNGDESAWFQTEAFITDPQNDVATCVDAWGRRITDCGITRFPDTEPPADRDLAFQLQGTILTPGVAISDTILNTFEGGDPVAIEYVLTAPPSAGSTVTVSPISGDVTEGSVSGALNFTSANWNVPQTVIITPGANGDGNDGDVQYNVNASVSDSQVAGCYDGVTAGSVMITNANIDGIANVLVEPSSALVLNEDSGDVVVTFTTAGTPTDPVTIPLTNNSPTEVSLSTNSIELNAGNGFTATLTISGVADDVVEDDMPFSITTDTAITFDVSYSFVNPVDLLGTVRDSDFAEVGVTPQTNPLMVDETGGSSSINYVLSAQPSGDVTIGVFVDDATEGSVSPTSLTFTNANWNTPQTVTVTGVDDQAVDGSVDFTVVAEPTTSTDPEWNALSVLAVPATNGDSGDTASFTLDVGDGVVTSETGSTDSFTVVLDSEPSADVSIDFRSDDTTEGLVGSAMGGPFSESVTFTFTPANWNTPQTVWVQGQDDFERTNQSERSDGPVVYTIVSENVTSADPNYAAITDAQVADVQATNEDDGLDIEGITVAPTSVVIPEDGAPETISVTLDTQPSDTVTVPVVTGDTTEATVDVTELIFTPANWDVAQTFQIIPQTDNLDDGDQTFNVSLGPATGGNYAGVSAAVSVTIENVQTCGPMTLSVAIGQPIIAQGSPGCVFDLYNEPPGGDSTFLGTFTIAPDGMVDTGVIAQPDGYYNTYITQTNILLTASPAITVPTLGEFGLMLFVLMMMTFAVVASRKRRQQLTP